VTSGGPTRRYFDGERPPPDRFAEHVLALWTFDVDIPEGESALHTTWPDGAAFSHRPQLGKLNALI